MNAILYRPNQEPEPILGHNFTLPNAEGYAEVTTEVAEALGCRREAVDVLTTGPKYVVYSIFDSAGEVNHAGMMALLELVSGALVVEHNDEKLRGKRFISECYIDSSAIPSDNELHMLAFFSVK